MTDPLTHAPDGCEDIPLPAREDLSVPNGGVSWYRKPDNLVKVGRRCEGFLLSSQGSELNEVRDGESDLSPKHHEVHVFPTGVIFNPT